jgi:hypothetical protein
MILNVNQVSALTETFARLASNGVWGTPILDSSLFHMVACSLVNAASTVAHVNTRHRDPSGAGFDSFIDMDETMEAMQ